MRRDTNVEPLLSSDQVSGIKALDIENLRPETSTTLADSVYAAIPPGPIVGSSGSAEAVA